MDFRRRLMAQPCKASRARIFRRSRSRVPWTRSFGLLISVTLMSIRDLLSVSKGKISDGASGPGYTEPVLSIYALKPGFQRVLRPLTGWLARSGVRANHVTVLAGCLSVGVGLLLTAYPEFHSLLLILPVFLIFRMAMNAIDGMLAREFDQKS